MKLPDGISRESLSDEQLNEFLDRDIKRAIVNGDIVQASSLQAKRLRLRPLHPNTRQQPIIGDEWQNRRENAVPVPDGVTINYVNAAGQTDPHYSVLKKLVRGSRWDMVPQLDEFADRFTDEGELLSSYNNVAIGSLTRLITAQGAEHVATTQPGEQARAQLAVDQMGLFRLGDQSGDFSIATPDGLAWGTVNTPDGNRAMQRLLIEKFGGFLQAAGYRPVEDQAADDLLADIPLLLHNSQFIPTSETQGNVYADEADSFGSI